VTSTPDLLSGSAPALSVPAGPRSPARPPEQLQQCVSGDVVRLDFGRIVVRIYRLTESRDRVWVRWLRANGSQSEPFVLGGSWKIVEFEPEGARERMNQWKQ
jgi:hypothetical protein